MWVTLSRSRPGNVARLISACRDTAMTTPAAVVLDYDDPMLEGYDTLDWPGGWVVMTGPRAPQSDLYNRVLDAYPNLDWYGILADDVVPRTLNWDGRLIEAAGPDGLAAPSGGHHATIAPHFCLGGDLVREMGWLSLPGLDRIYIDTAWNDIAKARGVFRHVPDVIVEHLHFSNGKALFDSTYKKHNKPRDKAIYEAWRTTFQLEKETK